MMLNPEWGVLPKKARHVPTDDIAMSCRVRLARNLVGERFPDWATEHDRERVFAGVREALRVEAPDLRVEPVAGFEEQDRDVLCESHLISKDLLDRAAGGGVAYAVDGSVCVMINEEDHLRIQGFAGGLDMQTAWSAADALDTRLERHLNYAWTPRLGYLTACPSNVGTGLRASAMLHLLGLRLLGEVEPVVRGLERMRLLVRGIGGEGSEAAGQIYQISNMDTLGADEATVVRRVARICAEVVRQEYNARVRLIQESPLVLVDCLARSLSVLQNARLLATSEALEFLSAMRLGASLGLCTRLKVQDVDKLILLMQPGHLQKGMGTAMTSDERDEMRAEFLSRKVANVKLKC
ncbi:MAG TPA: ATP--guanido phosphotransferase [Kiritimatiellia bacterium]|nr:ATP--guanido phosphotransferase [Kiritimatiellia bacterium]HPS08031.1 ATP--guanido phosphotransferase [Kiritimatiellia bacterium]